MSKKFLSVFLIIALVFSMSVSAMAAQIASPGTTTGKGEGDTVYLNTEIFDLVLPADTAFKFNLDPLGLLSLDIGDTSDLDELDGGKIIGVTPEPFVNDSSYPVKLTVALTATTAKGNGGLAPEATFIDDPEIVEDRSGAHNVLLYVAGSTKNWNDPDPDTAPAEDNYTMAANGFVLSDSGAVELAFSLPAANYIVTNNGGTYDIDVEDGTGSGNALKVGGLVNSKADWTEFSAETATDPADLSKVSIDLEYSFGKDTDAETYTDADFDADVKFMLKNATAKTVETGGQAGGQTGGYTTSGFITDAATYTTSTTKSVSSVNKANDVVVDFVLVDGEQITQVKWQTSGTTLASGTGYAWDATTKKFTVKGGSGTSLGTTTAGTKTVTIVTDRNAAGYVLTLNVV